MWKLNNVCLSIFFAAIVMVAPGCGEEEDDDDGTTGATLQITDTTAPTGSIYINSMGDTFTNATSVTLNISASDDYSGVSQMCISDTTTCTTWETYATTKAWTFPSADGTKTINVWFKDALGNANATPYSNSIIVDTAVSIDGTLSASRSASGSVITLDWSGFFDGIVGSGIKNYILVYSTGSLASCSAGTPVPNYTGTSGPFDHTGLSAGTTYYYWICAVDWVGNESPGTGVTVP